jgi:hypothetical protein
VAALPRELLLVDSGKQSKDWQRKYSGWGMKLLIGFSKAMSSMEELFDRITSY